MMVLGFKTTNYISLMYLIKFCFKMARDRYSGCMYAHTLVFTLDCADLLGNYEEWFTEAIQPRKSRHLGTIPMR